MATTDELIQNYLSNCQDFTENEYNKICEMYGKENVSKFFDSLYSTADKNKVDEILTKYHIYFEQHEKNINNDLEEIMGMDSQYIQSIDIVKSYIDEFKDIKLLDKEEEKVLFDRLSEIRSKLKILNIIDSSELRIDFATILMSIKDERQIKSLIKLYKASCKIKGIKHYENIINSKEHRKMLKKYLELYDEKHTPLSKKQISANFPNIDFTTQTIIPEDDYDCQIDQLIEFLTIIRKIEYCNLKLVISLSKRKMQKMPILDLIQEGNMGLRKAILKFDVNKGYKFSTYATWWINQAINRALMNQRNLIRKPVYIEEKIKRYEIRYFALLSELGRNPSLEEMSKELNISITACLEIQRLMMEPVSLDIPIGEDESTTMLDFISRDIFGENEYFDRKDLKEDIEKVLANFTPKEQDIIRHRFGLDDVDVMTLDELGKKYGVTRERIRQIEAKTLRNLRNPRNSKKLRDYL